VFYVAGKARGLYVGQTEGADRAFLFDPDPALPPGAAATPGVYAASGHLLYVRDRVLMARPFNASSRAVAGEAVKVADAVDYNPPGQSAFAAAGSVLVYRPRQHQRVATFTWVDRTGKDVGAIASPPGAFRQLSLSGDGRTAAVERRDAQGVASVWLMDLERGTSTRVPAEYWAGEPLWSFNDRDLSYSIASDSPPNLVVRNDRGAGPERRLTKSANIQYATSWTPDGRTIVFQAFSNDTGWNLFTIPAAGGPEQRLLQTPANETAARMSPDGRWFSYTSDESGRAEVYLARFPEADGRTVVSTGGGTRPAWRGDGRELFFITDDGWLMAAAVGGSGAERDIGAPARLFQSAFFNSLFAPAADGRRFLIAKPAASAEVVAMELRLNPLQ